MIVAHLASCSCECYSSIALDDRLVIFSKKEESFPVPCDTPFSVLLTWYRPVCVLGSRYRALSLVTQARGKWAPQSSVRAMKGQSITISRDYVPA